jgi:predicted enzyme related to lactoylglutathione lyase
VLFVTDVPRQTQFYQSVASMALLQADAEHAVLELMGFQLVVHALRGVPDASADISGGAVPREDAYVKLCLPVQRIAAVRDMVTALGGSLRPPDSEWSARGFRACDGVDPEGNVFQLRERAD